METERYGVTMKGSSIDTHMGSISINNEVIAQYAGSVAVECFGIVGMTVANVRDGLARILKPDNLIGNVKYKVEEFTGLEVEKINIYVEGVRVID